MQIMRQNISATTCGPKLLLTCLSCQCSLQENSNMKCRSFFLSGYTGEGHSIEKGSLVPRPCDGVA